MENLKKMIASDMPPPISPETVSSEAAQAARVRARLADALAKEANNPLLASSLKHLQQANGLSAAQMAAQLETSLAGLDRLALCRVPRDDRFFAEAETIARYCGCNLTALVSLLRSVQVLAAFAQPVVASAATAARSEYFGWQASSALVAARDKGEITECVEETESGEETVAPTEGSISNE